MAQSASVIVASHNIMHGLRLRRLVAEYRALRKRSGLDVLCIQENIPLARGSYASQIADQLGPGYEAVWDPARPSVAMVFDCARFDLRSVELLALSRSRSVSWIDRTYLQGGIVTPRFAQVVTFAPADGDAPVSIVNFHLQTAGTGAAGTQMRRRQIDEISTALEHSGRDRRVVACGDTNAFCWPWQSQTQTLQHILEPLTRIGARDPGVRPTHFFARQNEPKLTHRLGVLLGRAGLDLPMRYDVICTNLPVSRRGQAATPDSDHDVVWAALDPE